MVLWPVGISYLHGKTSPENLTGVLLRKLKSADMYCRLLEVCHDELECLADKAN